MFERDARPGRTTRARCAKPAALARRSGGFTLIEVAIALAIIGVVTAMTLPNVTSYLENANGRAAAKSVADAFNFARAQAIRTGNNHVVFFAIGGAGDTAGHALTSADGRAMPILVLNDGRPGSTDQNCEIDAGEETIVFEAQNGVGWGHNSAPATEQAPDDANVASIPSAGSSFFAPNGTTQVTWVQFRPDGVPVAIDNACTAGRLGTGGGTIYLWTDNRDYAVTLAPLGGVRVHVWNPAAGAWTS
ncbi:MAG: prepilin-type N-terminal cleavage/methylation domain-containing protein [Deltaproteobacteria bacterium]|nr:prepilin-type N-terminal cleavage/methylation domain-containing protein [Deltaproteobacteria bacterium]